MPTKIEPFLLEMGGMFRSSVVSTGWSSQPGYIGKMQFYLAVLDTASRLEGENPAIGPLPSLPIIFKSITYKG